MGESTCVACGECVQACPTGALMPAAMMQADRPGAVTPDRTVDSLCPYCGVGCQLTYHIKDDKLVKVEGRDGPANHGRLCVKGRFGFDYVHHKQRIDTPMVRRDGVGKDDLASLDPANPLALFREASWEEALDVAAAGLRAASATPTAARRSPGSARPRAPTRRPICSRSWCARASAPTTSTTAPACATRPRSRR